jgi:hypothetical protein
LSLLRFVRRIVSITNRFGTIGGTNQDLERTLTIGVNAAGRFIVRSIQVTGGVGGSPYFPTGVIAAIHSHTYSSQNADWNRPGGGDATTGKIMNIPAFVFGYDGHSMNPSLYEIGRNNGWYRERRIDTNGSPGHWQSAINSDVWNDANHTSLYYQLIVGHPELAINPPPGHHH